jgi:septal ring factor EnvC (AmiA/AmiB activator)
VRDRTTELETGRSVDAATIDDLRRDLDQTQAELQQARGDMHEVQAELASLLARCTEAERERDRLRGELEESQRVLDDILEGAEEASQALTTTLGASDRNALYDLLREWRSSMTKPPCRRRYSDQLYELAFVLHQYSRAGYDVLRQILALPSRQCLQQHFILHGGHGV